MFEQLRQVAHDARELPRFLAYFNHTDIKFAEKPRMLIQSGIIWLPSPRAND